MSTIMHDTPRPAWATSTQEPVFGKHFRGIAGYPGHEVDFIQDSDGWHAAEVTVGTQRVKIEQDIPADLDVYLRANGGPPPVVILTPEHSWCLGTQEARDLGAALLKATEIIDSA